MTVSYPMGDPATSRSLSSSLGELGAFWSCIVEVSQGSAKRRSWIYMAAVPLGQTSQVTPFTPCTELHSENVLTCTVCP
jgi:hypothetical protein